MSTLKLILWGHNHSDTKMRQSYKKKRKLQENTSEEHRRKNPQQNTTNPNPQYNKRIVYHDQVGFVPGMQGFFNTHKSISVIYHTTKLKNKNYWRSQQSQKKTFDKIQHPFMIKILSLLSLNHMLLRTANQLFHYCRSSSPTKDTENKID